MLHRSLSKKETVPCHGAYPAAGDERVIRASTDQYYGVGAYSTNNHLPSTDNWIFSDRMDDGADEDIYPDPALK